MSITKILTDEKLKAAEKLGKVAVIVAGARKSYGNEDFAVTSPEVNTASGRMSFVHLEDDSKISLLRNEVQTIKVKAIEFSKVNEGTNLNKKLEELIATSGMLCNVDSGTEFDYI
jgi:phosphosulfolactate phosphohydrolase-like enzyme